MSCELHSRPCSPWSLCGSVHWSTESEGLRFDSSWGLRNFFLSHACDKMKTSFFIKVTVWVTYKPISCVLKFIFSNCQFLETEHKMTSNIQEFNQKTESNVSPGSIEDGYMFFFTVYCTLPERLTEFFTPCPPPPINDIKNWNQLEVLTSSLQHIPLSWLVIVITSELVFVLWHCIKIYVVF